MILQRIRHAPLKTRRPNTGATDGRFIFRNPAAPVFPLLYTDGFAALDCTTRSVVFFGRVDALLGVGAAGVIVGAAPEAASLPDPAPSVRGMTLRPTTCAGTRSGRKNGLGGGHRNSALVPVEPFIRPLLLPPGWTLAVHFVQADLGTARLAPGAERTRPGGRQPYTEGPSSVGMAKSGARRAREASNAAFPRFSDFRDIGECPSSQSAR